MNSSNFNSFKINSPDDIKKQKDISNYHLLELVKRTATFILVVIMSLISFAFTLYILRFLYLTAFTMEEEMITRMQDIIIKLSGWILFIASQTGLIKNDRKNKEN